MLTWLRTKIRKWLLTEEDTPPLNTLLECVIDGKRVIFRITNNCGSMLMGVSADGQRIIGPGVACDVEHYQKLWDHFTEGATMTWVAEPQKEPAEGL